MQRLCQLPIVASGAAFPSSTVMVATLLCGLLAAVSIALVVYGLRKKKRWWWWMGWALVLFSTWFVVSTYWRALRDHVILPFLVWLDS